MTAPSNPAEVGALYLIRKSGAWYRPNSQGYTQNIAEAGRYTLAEAEAITHPNGPDGPRDHMSYELAPSPSPPIGDTGGVGEPIAFEWTDAMYAAFNAIQGQKSHPYPYQLRDAWRALNEAARYNGNGAGAAQDEGASQDQASQPAPPEARGQGAIECRQGAASEPQGLTASALVPARVEAVEPRVLGNIHAAIDSYVEALAARENGYLAQHRAFDAVCNALGRAPTQEMDARRAALQANPS